MASFILVHSLAEILNRYFWALVYFNKILLVFISVTGGRDHGRPSPVGLFQPGFCTTGNTDGIVITSYQ